ncbi:hypothetical protein FOZ61_007720 [Perkinsus olseni]|uniref:Uncharacterized protein n=1 Tax=Perkinsus olseni TaxID=32597 RepID=A0A7J6MQ94_PEROL|nr:hypothetical protein FOZ61_007720 [Perkinsus olseni]KAF4673497.1 hypothetical protein FOL46_007106 [Perkinsus olseni]
MPLIDAAPHERLLEVREVDLGGSHVLSPGLQYSNIFQDSQCGLRLWESGIVLARYLLAQEIPSGLAVLELGSGCGIAGIVVAAFLAPSSIFLTDGNERTIKNLALNVAASASCVTRVPTVERFVWGVDRCPGGRKFDLVIGSDLFYSKTAALQLAAAIDECLCEGGKAVLVAPASRSDESQTRDDFKRTMMDRRFLVTERTVEFPTGIRIGREKLSHDGEFEVLECRREAGGI